MSKANSKMAVHFSSETDDWATPQAFFDEMNKKYGPLQLDVCASDYNRKCGYYYSIDRSQDGLQAEWHKAWGFNSPPKCWMNPPYSDLKSWVRKAYEESKKGCTVVCLIPARTDTDAFHRYILPFSGLNSNNPQFAWAAGIIDGEGCIRVNKSNPTPSRRTTFPGFNLSVFVKMTDFPTIEKLQQIFGGRIQDEPRDNQRDLKRWEVYGHEAKRVLEQIYPHLVTKQYQAQLGIEFQLVKERKEGRRVTPEFLAECERYYYLIKEAKLQQSIQGTNTRIEFIKGRLKFGNAKNSAPFPSMVVVFRPPGDEKPKVFSL